MIGIDWYKTGWSTQEETLMMLIIFKEYHALIMNHLKKCGHQLSSEPNIV